MDKNIKPKISVVMAVYNSEKYLSKAIESILEQSFTDFEFIIINDDSTDKSEEIIKSYKDSRIKFLENESNMGHTYCLNRGISVVVGEYIARMDSDDVSLPERFQKQVEFMDSHKDVSVCGTWVKTIGKDSGFVNKLLTNPEDIKAGLLFNTSLVHPSVMIRKSVLEKHNLKYEIALDRDENSEDYALWAELSRKELLSNIPKVLLLYRIHEKSMSSINTQKQEIGASLIRQNQLTRLGLNPTPEDMLTHNSTRLSKNESIEMFLNREENWLLNIRDANDRTKIYKKESLEKVLYERWRVVCGLNTKEGVAVWKRFKSSPLSRRNNGTDSLKIFLKAILKYSN